MAANTASLVTNFNVSPYYDDYDETKNFHRILYKPGLAVQTRELTQMQTILQNQIDRFGKHVFVEGSRVAGGAFTIDDKYYYVKMPDQYANGVSITVSDWEGHVLRGSSSNVTAIVVGSASGSESATNKNTLFVKYTSKYGDNQYFTPGETLTSTTTSSLSANTLTAYSSVGIGTNFEVSEGIIFAKGHFIRFDTQSVVIDRYSDQATATVGFIISEDIVNSDSDTTLLDNAAGSFNYSAPGADRLKLTATLSSFSSLSSLSTAQKRNYVELLNIEGGRVQTKNEQTQYNEIRDYIASRTKDFFGDNIIKGMGLRLRDHLNDGSNNGLYRSNQQGDNDKLVVGIDPGKAYVQGYDIETFGSIYVPFNKGTDYVDVESIPVVANYGNYIEVDELCGNWNPSEGEVVKLYSTAQNAVSSTTYSATSVSGSEIGQARFKSLDHYSGNPGSSTCKYKLYLTDVNITANTFADVRSIYLNNSTTADGFADVVLDGGIAKLQETGFNKGIFSVPSTAVRTIRDALNNVETVYTFVKRFGVSISTAGAFTINTGDSSEVFIGSGVLNASEKDANFVLSLDAEAFATVSGTVTVSGTAVTGSGTAFTTQFAAGDKIYLDTNSEVRVISSITNDTSLTLTASATGVVGDTYSKYFAEGEVIDLATTGSTGTTRSVNVTSSTTAAFDVEQTFSGTVAASVYTTLSKTNAQEIAKTVKKNRYVKINMSSHSANTVGPWGLGVCDTFALNSVRIKYGSGFASSSEGTDVTSSFILDNGQRDTLYDHSRLLLKSDSTLTVNSSAYLLVNLNYFAHDYSQGSGYFSVDSYPIDDADSANTIAIQTEEIPRFISPVTGKIYDLRNSIDTRPSKTYTSTDATSVGSASVNPSSANTFNYATGGLRTPKANESFTIDYSYYLARQDILTLDKDGIFNIISGVPSLTPEAPRHNSKAMKLATIYIAPYPSLTSYRASNIGRPDYKCMIAIDKKKRYNSNDIETLEQRVTNLEYYTALSQVERMAIDQTILDSSGIDRFKNGIFTDPFLSHKFGDYTNGDYKVAIDKVGKEIRPQFDMNDIKLNYSSATNLVSFKSNTFFTLEYTDQSMVDQPWATTTRNIAGLYYTYNGSITLSPDGDYWVDTTRNPDLNVDYDFTNVPWEMLIEPWESNWSSWETVVVGAPQLSEQLVSSNFNTTVSDTVWSFFGDTIDRVTTTRTDVFNLLQSTTSTLERTRSLFNVDTTVQTREYGDRVVDVSLTPYLRSISIEVHAQGMKPFTKLYPYFDNEYVGDYCTPTNSSYTPTGARGADIVTDSTGTAYMLFTIPNDNTLRFRVGERMFVLSDSFNNSSVPGTYTTRAVAHFNGSGVQQTVEGTVVSTRVPFINETFETETRTETSTQFLGTRVDNNVTSVVPGGFVISPVGKSYENVNIVTTDGSYIDLAAIYSFTGSTLGDIIDQLNTNRTFFDTLSNATPGQLRNVIEAQAQAIFTANRATLATLNAFFTDFNAIIGVGANTASVRPPAPPPRWIDPVLQTFKVNEGGSTPGLFVTKVDLYFATKDSTNGVQIELREIDQGTGAPTNRIIPNSIVTVPAASINTSTTGATATTVTFETPIYLLNNTWYGIAIKPIGNNTSTSVWVSRLGELDVASDTRVNEQPYVGLLYASSNDQVYNAIQEEDLKFRLYRAEFDISKTGELIIANENADYMTAASYTGSLIVGETVTGNNSGSTGVVKRVWEDASGTTRLVITNTSGAFNTSDTLTGSQSSANVAVSTIYDVPLHVGHNEITSIVPTGATISTSIQTTSNTNNISSTWVDVNNTRDVHFNSERKIASRSTEISSLSSNKTYKVKNTATTLNPYISPVIDLSRSFATAVGNRLSDSATNEDSQSGGNSVTRYISKIITLAQGQDAEDLNVFLDEYRPSTADIKVYVKLLNADDPDTFEDKSWIELTKLSKELYSSTDNKQDFYEAYYSLPTASMTGGSGEVQYVNSNGVTYTGYKYFAIKIVMIGTNKATPPRARNLRAIALQI